MSKHIDAWQACVIYAERVRRRREAFCQALALGVMAKALQLSFYV